MIDMVKKINIYKTIEKAISAQFIGVESAFVSNVTDDSCADLFYEENEKLLNDTESEEFKKFVDNALKEHDGIYIALAYVSDWSEDGNENQATVETYNGEFTIERINGIDEASDYGVLVDEDLNLEFVHRFIGDFSSGAFYTDIRLGFGEAELLKIMNDCIVYDE